MIGRKTPPFFLTGRTILEVTRTSAGSRVNGRYVPGATSIVEVVANVQPYQRRSGEVSIAEGDRDRSLLKIFAKERMVAVTEGNPSVVADTFLWNGETYEVIQVQYWGMGNMDHYECLAIKKERT